MSNYGPASVLGGALPRQQSGFFPSQDNVFESSASAHGYSMMESPGFGSNEQFHRVDSQPLLSSAPPAPAFGQLPSEERLVWDIEQLVSISDLNTVSKKSIRTEL